MNHTSISYLILTSRAIQDNVTSRWSYIDLFNYVAIDKKLGFSFNSFFIVGRISDAPIGNIAGAVTMYKPNGDELARAEFSGVVAESPLVPGNTDTDVVVSFESVKFEEEGHYTYSITVNNETYKEDRFYLEVLSDVAN